MGRIGGGWLAVLLVLAWWPAAFGVAVYDDVLNFDRNLALREFDLPRLLTEPFFREHLHYWRPFSQLVMAVADRAGSVGIHATAMLLHGLAAWFVLLILRRRPGTSAGTALVGGCLFVVHPLHAESVAWASALPDVLAGTCSLAALAAAMSARRGARWVAALLLLLAMFAKESAVAMAPALVLAPVLAGHGARRWSAPHAVAAAVAVAVWLSLRSWVIGPVSIDPFGSVSPWCHVTGGAEVFLRQLALLFVPWPLTPFRVGPAAATATGALVGGLLWLGLALAVVLVACGGWWRGRRWGIPLLVLVGPLLLPAICWPALGEFCIQDRYGYASALGLVLLAAPFVARRGRVVVVVLVAGIALANGQARIWRDQRRLVEHGLQVAPELATIQVMAGDQCLAASGDAGEATLVQARGHYDAALVAVLPRDAALQQERRSSAYIGLGWCDFLSPSTVLPRDAARVAEYFRRGIAEHAAAAPGWVGLGAALAVAQDRQGAERAFRRAIAIDPELPEAWFNLATLQVELGAHALARQSLQRALRYRPGFANAQRLLDELRAR
ncbi:MAG: tetratricopeptide repeat protein [Planctomycetes bacterium]|nr:tetratricopeptide repeat protein [Planctomycetota bacterium]